MPPSIEDVAKRFGVSTDEVEVWKEQGAPLDVPTVDLAEIEAWRASQEWADSGDASEVRTALLGTAGRLSREEAECQKLREEARKLRAEAFRFIREASHLRLRWWQKPGVWLAMAPIVLALAGFAGSGFFWMWHTLDEIKNSELIAEVKDLKQYKAALETIAESGGVLSIKNEAAGISKYTVVFDPPPDTTAPSKLGIAAEPLIYLEHVDEVVIDTGFYATTGDFFSKLMKNPKAIWLRRVVLKGKNPIFDTIDLVPLQEATHLTDLTLTVSMTEKTLDLRNIAKLRQLEKLDLSGTNIDDASLANLAGIHYLTKLDLSRTPITAAGVKHLKNLPYLEELTLKNTHVDSRAVEYLSGLDGLKMLDLEGTDVDDSLLATLKDKNKLVSLETLVLSGTKVDEESLAAFQPVRDAIFVIYEKPDAQQAVPAEN